MIEPDQAYLPVDLDLIKTWALCPLREEADFDAYPDTGFLPGPLYEVGLIDDLGRISIDSFVYLGRNYDVAANPTFTVRLRTVSTSAAGVAPGDYGNQTPAWVTNPAPALEFLISADGINDIQEPASVGKALVFVLGDTDAALTGVRPTVTFTNVSTGETETIQLVEDALLDWRFEALLPTAADPLAGVSHDGTMNWWPDQMVTVTYVDAWDGTTANVTKTDLVGVPPASSISVSEPASAGEPLIVSLFDADLSTIAIPTVLVTNNTGEAETVALSGDPLLYATFTAELPTAAVPPDTLPIVDEDGGLDVWPGQIVDATYVDALDGTHTNVLKTVTVIITGDDTIPEEPAPDQGAAASSGDGGGGLCSYNPEARFDPILPTLVLIGLGYLGFRRKSDSGA